MTMMLQYISQKQQLTWKVGIYLKYYREFKVTTFGMLYISKTGTHRTFEIQRSSPKLLFRNVLSWGGGGVLSDQLNHPCTAV